MILSTLFLGAALTAIGVPAQEVSWEAPTVYVRGGSFDVSLTIEAGEAGASVEAWRLGPAAFEVDGIALGERGEGAVSLPAGARLTLEFDLGPHIQAGGGFKLGLAGDETLVDVAAYQAVPRGAVDFLGVPDEELAKYKVLLATNQGGILVELWPDVAPNHVRNFCDLVNTGFYEGILFHRVSPSFMIQGGCPNTREQPNAPHLWGTGNGPRRVPAEFNSRKHLPGVLSAARGPDPDSASSQFFLMTRANAGLDGSYSAFGKVLDGMDAVTRIASAGGTAGRDGTIRPSDPQRIDRSYVLLPL